MTVIEMEWPQKSIIWHACPVCSMPRMAIIDMGLSDYRQFLNY